MTTGVTSVGYPQDVGKTNVDWANLQLALGKRYMVADFPAAKVSPKSNGTRQVNIATGVIGGWGVLDTITTVQTVTLPTVASGTRWFLICARRTWTPASGTATNGETSFVAIDAGTSNSTLPARSADGNVAGATGVDDQPLALVPLTAGDTVPGVPIDIRAINSGGAGQYIAADLLALQYMAWPGVTVRIGNKTWRRVMDGSGNPVWDADPLIVQSGPGLGNPLQVSGATGWVTVSERTVTATRSGNTITLDVEARRSGADLAFGTDAGFADANGLVMTIANAAWLPPRKIPLLFFYVSDANTSFTGGATLDTDGSIRINDGKPSTHIIKLATAGAVSFRAHIVWNRES